MLDGRTGALDDDDPVDAAAFFNRRIDIGLQRHSLAAAQALVRGDDDLGLAIRDALGEAVGREAGEYHRMNGADPRAGQHGVGGLRDHRQIDGDAVALHDIAGAQDVGHLADFVVQLPIGDVLRFGRVVALPDDRGLVAAGFQMPVDAVPGNVEDAVLEPFDRDIAGREGGILDLVERLDPVDPLGLVGPEAIGIADRAGIHFTVLGVIDKGALRPVTGYVVNLVGHRPLHSIAAGKRATARLDCCDDYASPGDARTRRKLLRPWSACPSRSPVSPATAITIAFCGGRKSRLSGDGRDATVSNNHSCGIPDSQSPSFPPKWPPRGRTVPPEQRPIIGITGRTVGAGRLKS